MEQLKQLLFEYENKLDHTNLLDVVYAVASLNFVLKSLRDETDGILKDEYALYLFHANDLLGILRKELEEKEDVFATAHGILCSCIDVTEKYAILNQQVTNETIQVQATCGCFVGEEKWQQGLGDWHKEPDECSWSDVIVVRQLDWAEGIVSIHCPKCNAELTQMCDHFYLIK